MNLKKGNINIENSTCEKLLAVKVDNKLNFNEQLDGKASRTVTLSRFMAILFSVLHIVTSSVTVTLRIWTLWRSIYRNN